VPENERYDCLRNFVLAVMVEFVYTKCGLKSREADHDTWGPGTFRGGGSRLVWFDSIVSGSIAFGSVAFGSVPFDPWPVR
jgi:hypothetical protein